MSKQEYYKDVIRELENQKVHTEEIYELENLKHDFDNEIYIDVMNEVYENNYEDAIEIIEDLD